MEGYWIFVRTFDFVLVTGDRRCLFQAPRVPRIYLCSFPRELKMDARDYAPATREPPPVTDERTTIFIEAVRKVLRQRKREISIAVTKVTSSSAT